MIGITSKLLRVLIPVFAILVVIGACSKQGTEVKDIKIGVLLPLTGEAASYGQDCQKGIQMALEEANLENGKQITAFFEDTKADPKTAVAAFNKLVSVNKATAIIGDMFSSTTLAVAPIAQQSKITLLTPTAADEKIPATGEYIYSIYPLATAEGEFLAGKLDKSATARTAIIFQNQQATKSIADAFSAAVKKSGGNIVITESLPEDKSSYRSIMEKIAAQKPTTVFFSAYKDPVALLITTGKELGMKTQYVSQSTLYDDKVLSDYANKLDGVLVSGPYFDKSSTDPKAADFSKKYQSKYNQPPTVWAAYGYDAANLMILACREALTSGVPAKDKLAGRTYEGLTGKTVFRPDRSVDKQMVLFEIQSNKFVRK